MKIATQELHAGRLLHVQAIYKPTGLPITILALYQHVWRTSCLHQKIFGYGVKFWILLGISWTTPPPDIIWC